MSSRDSPYVTPVARGLYMLDLDEASLARLALRLRQFASGGDPDARLFVLVADQLDEALAEDPVGHA